MTPIMENLHQKKCVACEGGIPPLVEAQISPFMDEIGDQWRLLDAKRIVREYRLRNFKEAINFVYEVAKIAEEEGHHPEIHISYNKVVLELWTHAIGGLSVNDFIVAAKINALPYGT